MTTHDAPTIAHRDDTVTIWRGDCLDVMRQLPDSSVDAIVTDPPYGLGFMGKAWDDLPPGYDWAVECLRVLKPGGHLMTFGGTRTWHRLAVAVEDAGFEVRDSIAWLYGSGFPKSLDVSKAIDKMHGADREVIGAGRWASVRGVSRAATQGASNGGTQGGYNMKIAPDETAPATDAARTWQGWGTALKPAFEPIVVARKPLTGTVAGNVLTWGTGALNIDACRVSSTVVCECSRHNGRHGECFAGCDLQGCRSLGRDGAVPSVPRGRFAGSNNGMAMDGRNGTMSEPHAAGRWPANVVLDGSQADALDASGPATKDGTAVNRRRDPEVLASDAGWGYRKQTEDVGYGGEGGPSRFFPTFRYQAKAPTSQRPSYIDADGNKQSHATVKPLDLMRWLVRLVTPPGGVVLEPFAGSGTTVEACILEGFGCIAIEREADYLPLIAQRMARARAQLPVKPEADDEHPAAPSLRARLAEMGRTGPEAEAAIAHFLNDDDDEPAA